MARIGDLFAGKKTMWVLLAGGTVTAIFLGAGWLSQRLFEAPARPTTATRPSARSLLPAIDERRFRVTGIQGPVECEQQGRRYVLQAGDLLSVKDVIRTPPGARVILKRDKTEIELRESLELRLEELGENAARFGLLRGDGDISAQVTDGSEDLTINTDLARANSRGPARWVVSLTDKGKVSVTVGKGEVRLRARDEEVVVPAGYQSAADPGQAPTAPQAVSEDLLLSVTWPELPAGGGTTVVKGKTAPNARLSVNDRVVDVAADGSFAAPLPLRAGKNPIEIKARDPMGNSKTVKSTLEPRAPSPTLEATGEELWKK